MTKYYFNFHLVVILALLSCENPTSSQNQSFSLKILNPAQGAAIGSSPIGVVTKITNPNVITTVDFFINDEIWCSTAPADTIRLEFHPTNLLIGGTIEIKAQASNENMQFSDSVVFAFSANNETFFEDSTLVFLPCCDGNDEFQIMKFPVTNQLYAKYLNMVFQDSLVEYNENTHVISGFFPGTEFIPPGYYDFYDGDKGRISIENGGIQIEANYKLHPVTGVTWVSAKSFANYFGWRIPTQEEWLNAAMNVDSLIFPLGNEINPDMANFANYYNGTTPVGYYNGTNIGTVACTDDAYNINGLYDIIGNVWEFNSSFMDNPEFISACGGDYSIQLDSLIIVDELFTSIPYIIASSRFGFRCIAEMSIPQNNSSWNGPDGGSIEDDCGICDGPGTTLWYEDNDGDGLGSGDGQELCEFPGVGWVDNNEDEDDNCFSNNYDCAEICDGESIFDPCDNCVLPDDTSCPYDCAGVVEGIAEYDDCGDCYCNGEEPEQGFTCNEEVNMAMDCNNECFGSAFMDDSCGCVGGNTGWEEGWCIGCTDWQADNFFCNLDPGISCCDYLIGNYVCHTPDASNCDIQACEDSTNAVGSTYITFFDAVNDESACEYWGCSEGNADNFFTQFMCINCPNSECEDGLCPNINIPEECEHWGCTDPIAANYDVNATSCEGSDPDDFNCCAYNVNLSFTNIDLDNSSVSIFMVSTGDVYGFQFDISGISITAAELGIIVPSDWMVSFIDNTVIAFSLNGTFIPAGEGNLLDLTISITNDQDICIENAVFSNEGGTLSHEIDLGDCIDILSR